ncbi:hypothetical protein IB234_15240 [Pseudomonas sp. PDM16]|nr:hypothetical protein [Pseudomonas sp. PDM16]MBD9415916.1 hypothetical protein [Pseudomonas sp. PDM16]
MHKQLALAACLVLVIITAAGGFPWLLEHAMQLITGCPDHLLICPEQRR